MEGGVEVMINNDDETTKRDLIDAYVGFFIRISNFIFFFKLCVCNEQ